jgi:hypothetical protein
MQFAKSCGGSRLTIGSSYHNPKCEGIVAPWLKRQSCEHIPIKPRRNSVLDSLLRAIQVSGSNCEVRHVTRGDAPQQIHRFMPIIVAYKFFGTKRSLVAGAIAASAFWIKR